jgi:hypothetical protein
MNFDLKTHFVNRDADAGVLELEAIRVRIKAISAAAFGALKMCGDKKSANTAEVFIDCTEVLERTKKKCPGNHYRRIGGNHNGYIR